MGQLFPSFVPRICFVLLVSGLSSAQVPALNEEAAFQQARAQVAPELRISSLSAYLDHFPSGSHNGAAQELLLKTYLNALPDRTAPYSAAFPAR